MIGKSNIQSISLANVIEEANPVPLFTVGLTASLLDHAFESMIASRFSPVQE
jgi:hypothetical protein